MHSSWVSVQIVVIIFDVKNGVVVTFLHEGIYDFCTKYESYDSTGSFYKRSILSLALKNQ